MKKTIAILILLLYFCFGCGSRKVEHNKSTTENKTSQSEVVKNDVSKNTNVKIETNIKTIDSTKEIIEEMIIEADDKSKPAIFEGKDLGNTKTTKRKINRNKAITINENINASINEKTTDKTIKTSKKAEQRKENLQTKKVDREQFDIIGLILSYWWLLVLIILIVWLYKKYKNILFI